MLLAGFIGSILKSVFVENFFKLSGVIAVVLAAFLLVWHFLVPGRPEADRPRKNIADRAVVKLTEDLRRSRGELKEVAVMHFKNDGSDYMTNTLRNKLATSGVFEVAEADIMEKIANMLKLRVKGSFSVKEAVAYGKKFEVPAVITGNLERFESIKNGAVILGTVRVISVPDGKIIAEIRIKESSAGKILDNGKLSAGIGSSDPASEYPWHIRFLIFIMAALLLPVMTISFIRYMVSRRSNGCNAFVLGIYTVIDLILAYFMVGGFGSVFCTMIFLTASILAFFYNVSIMSFALKLES